MGLWDDTSFGYCLSLCRSCVLLCLRNRIPANVLPFKICGQQLIVVQGSIGQLEKRNFVIDTGAYPTVIDRELAGKLTFTDIRKNWMRSTVLCPAWQ